MSQIPTIDPGFSTDDLVGIYSAEGTVHAMLEFEAALALALADVGIAPAEEAEQVALACRSGVDDPDHIVASTWDAGTPLIALREAVVSRIEDESAQRWFHHGATTQDTVDTAQMIQAGAALDKLNAGLVSIASRLRELTVAHRDRAHRGRTFLQDARPTTFGFRTAMWLDPVLQHIEELGARRSDLAVQLGGPVGTLEEYGGKGTAVTKALAERLGLAAPDISWHNDRTRIWSLAQTVERCSMTMAKIGSDVAILASSGLAEITVRSGRSSSMPGKKNPIDSLRAIAAAAACSGAVNMLSSAPPNELDRGVGGWHVEWIAVPLVFHTAGAAIEAIDACLGTLDLVDKASEADAAVVTGVSRQIDAVLEKAGRILN